MNMFPKVVAAYCRVSTDSADQANSFESQKRYFALYIERNPEWRLYEIYADEGITGTNTKKRKAFQRMIEDAKKGCFDLILTKEISRFARNILDSIYYTRELKRHGVGVLFMNDNIYTMDGDAELRLAILSSIAQEESRKTSERVKWGQKRRMEMGIVFGSSMLGYDVRGGNLYINEDGAAVVRSIFHKFTEEGKGTHLIAKELDEEGIKPMRAKNWNSSVVLRILKNEKYCGDLVQKKTYTPDYLSHEKKYNRGAEELVVLRDHHVPIISREIFEKTSMLLSEKKMSGVCGLKRYIFSGMLCCGICGEHLIAHSQTGKRGIGYLYWRCPTHDIPSVRNDDVLEMVRTSLRNLKTEVSAEEAMCDEEQLFEKNLLFVNVFNGSADVYLKARSNPFRFSIEKDGRLHRVILVNNSVTYSGFLDK